VLSERIAVVARFLFFPRQVVKIWFLLSLHGQSRNGKRI